jgi:hypothetical protein
VTISTSLGRRRTTRRVVALAACVWLVLAGVLGLRHEAGTAHVAGAHGEVLHGARAIDHHDRGADERHFHAGAGHADDDECWLTTALHQAGAPASPITLIAAATPGRAPAAPAARTAAGRSTLLRFAPKTSPPAA